MMSMEKSELKKILASPTLFTMQILKIKPFPYQARILEDDAKRMLIVGGRNIGKTTTLAIKSLWNAFVKPNYEVLIVAPTLRQSRIVYETIRTMIGKSKIIHSKASITMHETRFDNGSVIRIVPVGEKGNIARGFHPDMLLFDEVAFMPDDAVLSIEPSVLPKDGVIIYSSTPYGKKNRFYELYHYNMRNSEWSIYQIPTWHSPLISAKKLDSIRRTVPEIFYMQEYGATFVEEVGMLYPYSMVLKNAVDYEYSTTFEKETIMGVDTAGGGDDEHAIVIVADEGGDSFRVVFAKAIPRRTFRDLGEYIYGLVERFNVKQVNIERNGVGEGLYQELMNKAIAGVDVNGFYAVGKERLNMYLYVKTLLEQGRLTLNKNDRKMLLQSSNYELKESADGSVRVLKGKGHDDLWDALVYALYTKNVRVGVLEGMMEVI